MLSVGAGGGSRTHTGQWPWDFKATGKRQRTYVATLVPVMTRSFFCCLRCNIPPDTSLLFGAVFGDPAPNSFGERTPESSGFKIPTVGRRSGLLPPGVGQIATVDRVKAKIVDKAKHCCLGVQRIAEDRESYPPRRSPRNAFLEKALGQDVVERLDDGTPDLPRDPLAVKHALVDCFDAAIAKLRVVVAGIDHDTAWHVRK